jgi:hypothetical protein
MSKKVLLSVAAVALLAMTAFAGDFKYEDWPTATYTKTVTDTREVPTLIEVIPVEIHIPYYVIVYPQNEKIMLKQVGQEGDERFHFRGVAFGKDDKNKKRKTQVHTNFPATLSTNLVVLPPGKALETPKKTKWTHGVDAAADHNPYNLNEGPWPKATTCVAAPTVPLTIDPWVDVTMVNLMAFHQCQTLHVADLLLLIMHN